MHGRGKSMTLPAWMTLPSSLSTSPIVTDNSGSLKILKGKVIDIKQSGAVVKLGSVIGGYDEGFVHISKLATKRVENVSEVVEIGKEVWVKVEKIENGRVNLSMSYIDQISGEEIDKKNGDPRIRNRSRDMDSRKRETRERPPLPYLHSIHKGKVVDIREYGAFVELVPHQRGLVHISRISPFKVESIDKVVTLGDQVWVKVINVEENPEQRHPRIDLSMKAINQENGEDLDPNNLDSKLKSQTQPLPPQFDNAFKPKLYDDKIDDDLKLNYASDQFTFKKDVNYTLLPDPVGNEKERELKEIKKLKRDEEKAVKREKKRLKKEKKKNAKAAKKNKQRDRKKKRSRSYSSSSSSSSESEEQKERRKKKEKRSKSKKYSSDSSSSYESESERETRKRYDSEISSSSSESIQKKRSLSQAKSELIDVKEQPINSMNNKPQERDRYRDRSKSPSRAKRSRSRSQSRSRRTSSRRRRRGRS